MTIDEKIKQGSAVCKQDRFNTGNDSVDTMLLGNREWGFIAGANFVKSEMLADMQKLADALEFYADMAKDDNYNLDDCLERACLDRAESKEYNLGGKYVAKKALQALAEFNAKYKEQK